MTNNLKPTTLVEDELRTALDVLIRAGLTNDGAHALAAEILISELEERMSTLPLGPETMPLDNRRGVAHLLIVLAGRTLPETNVWLDLLQSFVADAAEMGAEHECNNIKKQIAAARASLEAGFATEDTRIACLLCERLKSLVERGAFHLEGAHVTTFKQLGDALLVFAEGFVAGSTPGTIQGKRTHKWISANMDLTCHGGITPQS